LANSKLLINSKGNDAEAIQDKTKLELQSQEIGGIEFTGPEAGPIQELPISSLDGKPLSNYLDRLDTYKSKGLKLVKQIESYMGKGYKYGRVRNDDGSFNFTDKYLDCSETLYKALSEIDIDTFKEWVWTGVRGQIGGNTTILLDRIETLGIEYSSSPP
jgi:hypothetical protein